MSTKSYGLQDIFSPMERLVESRVTDAYLDKRLEEDKKRGTIQSEQWFRNPDNWFFLSAFLNPYRTPFTELEILFRCKVGYNMSFGNKTKVFYGVGTGDTETFIVRNDLQFNSYSEVISVDVGRKFIDGYVIGLRNLTSMYRKVRAKADVKFKAYHDIFQNTSLKDFKISGRKYKNAIHICLGATPGNFDQKEFFDMMDRNMEEGDMMLLGIQSNEFVDVVLNSYQSDQFNKFLMDSVGTKLGIKELEWVWNGDENQIEAWAGDLCVFRTRKYDIEKFEEFLSERGYETFGKVNSADVYLFSILK